MNIRYIVQMKKTRNSQWESMQSFEAVQDAIEFAVAENHKHPFGAAKHRVWNEHRGDVDYERGWLVK